MERATEFCGVAPADIGETREPRCQRHEVDHMLVTDRQGIEQFPRDHLRPADVLHVDRRRRTGHRDRLGDGADAQLGIDIRGELGNQLNPLADHPAKPGQLEGDGVRAGSQIDDGIEARRIGDHDPLRGQRGTGGRHRHARQDAPGVVGHGTGDRLRPRGGRKKQRTHTCADDDAKNSRCSHGTPFQFVNTPTLRFLRRESSGIPLRALPRYARNRPQREQETFQTDRPDSCPGFSNRSALAPVTGRVPIQVSGRSPIQRPGFSSPPCVVFPTR